MYFFIGALAAWAAVGTLVWAIEAVGRTISDSDSARWGPAMTIAFWPLAILR